MSDFVFTVALGSVAEKVRANPGRLGVLLLQEVEDDDSLRSRRTVEDILSRNVEADFSNYRRQTDVGGDVFVDPILGRVDVDMPDQRWNDAGGIVDNQIAKLIVFYEDEPDDARRVPLTAHDFSASTDGGNLIAEVAGAGFYRAT